MSLSQMSASGAALILVTVIIRALAINRLPKKAFLVLWGIALVRLLIPYSVPSAFSVYSLLGRVSSQAESLSIVSAPTASIASAVIAASGITGNPSPAVHVLIDPLMLVWLVGAVACALFFTFSYWKCRREFKESLPVENDSAREWLREHALRRRVAIRYSDRISAPLTYGVFRPVILMPKTTDWNDTDSLKYVLAHEYIHIRRFDAVAKLVLTAALCVHWLNPAVWIMYVLSNRDIELSCDESVVRQFGERTKAAYAMTLIRMEESRSGLTPLCNSFSKNAIEERIIAIMKMKKTSMAALLAALAMVACVTIGFATSAQAAPGKTVDKKAADISPNADQVTEEGNVISYTDSQSGTTLYSWDGGRTWTTMSDEEYIAQKISGIEWWTAEEYAKWLEQEKIDLQACIGDKGWTPSTGWFTWDQQMVDETVAQYEQTLKDIRNGLQISKPVDDGDTEMMFSYDPKYMQSDSGIMAGSGTFIGFDENGQMQSARIPSREHLKEYRAFGLTYDEEKQVFFWKGALVRYFSDEYDLGGGIAVLYSYVNGDGAVDIRAVRQAVQNADGSTDPIGKLIGIVECSQEEFDNRTVVIP